MSRTTWVTADTHFGHAEAISMFGRESIVGSKATGESAKAETSEAATAEMNEALLERINSSVGKKDRLFHLGDFTGPMPRREKIALARDIRRKIRCRRIVLIRGNHDPVDSDRFDDLFESVHDLISFKPVPECRAVLTHYPLRIWQGQRSGSVHLYCHTHGTIPEVGRSTDVGVDCWNYSPLLLTDLMRSLQSRPIECQSDFQRCQPMRKHVYTQPGGAS